MKDWFNKRIKEPSTYLGLALLVEGVGNLAKIEEAGTVSAAVKAAAPSLSAGDWTTGVLAFIMGIGGILVKEKVSR